MGENSSLYGDLLSIEGIVRDEQIRGGLTFLVIGKRVFKWSFCGDLIDIGFIDEKDIAYYSSDSSFESSERIGRVIRNY